VVYRRTAGVQARLDAQRTALVAAATAQLAEHGYAGCTVAAVARRAGVAAGSVYNHFSGKEELVREVFLAVVGNEVSAVEQAVAATTGAAAGLTAFVETFAGRALRVPRLAHALLAEPVDPGVDKLRLRFRTAFREIAAKIVCGGVTGGELPEQDARLVAAALVGAVGEALVGPLATPPDAVPSPDLVPELVAFALRSTGAIGVDHAVHA
jgi:AcrR family transcriptional regulator